MGAEEAVILSSTEVTFDPRVQLKCLYPKCRWYATNAQCPPHAPTWERVKDAFSGYRYCLFYRLKVPAEAFVGKHFSEEVNYNKYAYQRQNHKIASLIEAAAFYDGYMLALSLAGGPCKPIFCPGKECTALQSGQGCQAALKARGSMESVGINAIKMAAKVSWDIYPCAAYSEEVPRGSCLGLVMVD